MTPEEIRALVARMDTPQSTEADQAWERLRALGAAVVPYLREAYPNFRKAQGRAALLFHAIRYARESEDARAAMDAIAKRNHHCFVDRTHTGRSFWHVNEGDTPHGGPAD